MPRSLEKAIADPLSPDLAWLPGDVANIPAIGEIDRGIEILTEQIATAPRKHISHCLAKLVMAFEPTSQLSGEATTLRLQVWVEACGDIPTDLWSTATLEAMQTCKWMPKPAEFRAIVAARLTRRQTQLSRAQRLKAFLAKPLEATAETREPLHARLRAMRDAFRRHGQLDKAAHYERELAKVVGREPHDWATNRAANCDIPSTIPAPAPAGFQRPSARLANIARNWHASGADGVPKPLKRNDDPDDVPWT